jgi:hypothetical protein
MSVSVNAPSSEDLPEIEDVHAIDMSEKNVRVSDKWVGLTDDEIWGCFTLDYIDFARAIEAKLKEKNND